MGRTAISDRLPPPARNVLNAFSCVAAVSSSSAAASTSPPSSFPPGLTLSVLPTLKRHAPDSTEASSLCSVASSSAKAKRDPTSSSVGCWFQNSAPSWSLWITMILSSPSRRCISISRVLFSPWNAVVSAVTRRSRRGTGMSCACAGTAQSKTPSNATILYGMGCSLVRIGKAEPSALNSAPPRCHHGARSEEMDAGWCFLTRINNKTGAPRDEERPFCVPAWREGQPSFAS